jgi:hypothetical protein
MIRLTIRCNPKPRSNLLPRRYRGILRNGVQSQRSLDIPRKGKQHRQVNRLTMGCAITGGKRCTSLLVQDLNTIAQASRMCFRLLPRFDRATQSQRHNRYYQYCIGMLASDTSSRNDECGEEADSLQHCFSTICRIFYITH